MPDVSDIPNPASPAPGSASEASSSPVALSHSRSVALPFTPSIEKEKQVLNDLACGDYSFVEIAQNHDTTVEALSAWMATDEVAQRLAMIESGPARQARLVATIRMPDAVRALTAALDNLRFEEEHAVTDHKNQRIRELRRRGADTLRKICALLHRITRFYPLPEGGGRGKGSLRDTASLSSRATACSPSSATSSAGCLTRPEPLSALSTNPPAPITPESIEELRAFLETLLTPSPPSATPSLDPSVTSPASPPHQPNSDVLTPSCLDAPPTDPISLRNLRALLLAIREKQSTAHSPLPSPQTTLAAPDATAPP